MKKYCCVFFLVLLISIFDQNLTFASSEHQHDQYCGHNQFNDDHNDKDEIKGKGRDSEAKSKDGERDDEDKDRKDINNDDKHDSADKDHKAKNILDDHDDDKDKNRDSENHDNAHSDRDNAHGDKDKDHKDENHGNSHDDEDEEHDNENHDNEHDNQEDDQDDDQEDDQEEAHDNENNGDHDCDHKNEENNNNSNSCLCSGQGQLEGLQLQYTGKDCAASMHSQDDDSYSCSGDTELLESVHIVVADKLDLGSSKTNIIYDGILNLNETFFLNGTMTKHNKIAPKTYVYVYNLNNELLQTVYFHTSCSQPLNPGDQFGSIMLKNGIRDAKRLVDECGICGGDGSSCMDCNGIPRGDAVLDLCGICGGLNSCFDCKNIPFGDAKLDKCGVCGGDDSSCLDCAGVANGHASLDLCNVCNGNNACLDCNAVAFGDAKIDECGVCGGDNACLSCADNACDCLGVPGGSAKLDQCGVCGGNNECLDCAGAPFGTAKLDQCGVCAGDNSCLDCEGKPFGQLQTDRCGVCGGAGESCIECNNVNITEVQGALDSTGFAMQAAVISALRMLKKAAPKMPKAYFKKSRATAVNLYIELWSLGYSFPADFLQCNASPFCIEVSQQTDLEHYRGKITEMDKLFTKVKKQLKKIGKKPSKNVPKLKKAALTKVTKLFDSEREQALASVNLIPGSHSECL